MEYRRVAGHGSRGANVHHRPGRGPQGRSVARGAHPVSNWWRRPCNSTNCAVRAAIPSSRSSCRRTALQRCSTTCSEPPCSTSCRRCRTRIVTPTAFCVEARYRAGIATPTAGAAGPLPQRGIEPASRHPPQAPPGRCRSAVLSRHRVMGGADGRTVVSVRPEAPGTHSDAPRRATARRQYLGSVYARHRNAPSDRAEATAGHRPLAAPANSRRMAFVKVVFTSATKRG